MFKKDKISDFNYRSDFANFCCKLLWDKYNGDIDSVLKSPELPQLYLHFDEHVRNVYELIGDEIPLFGIYDFDRHGRENFGYNEEEFEEIRQSYVEGCEILFN